MNQMSTPPFWGVFREVSITVTVTITLTVTVTILRCSSIWAVLLLVMGKIDHKPYMLHVTPLSGGTTLYMVPEILFLVILLPLLPLFNIFCPSDTLPPILHLLFLLSIELIILYRVAFPLVSTLE